MNLNENGEMPCETCEKPFRPTTPCDDTCDSCRLDLADKEVKRLAEENQKLRDGVASFSGTAGELDTERRDLQDELEKLQEKVCDECDGSGTYYLTSDDETEERSIHPCVCVSETASYQKLVSDLEELRDNHLPKVKGALDRANKIGAECDRQIQVLETNLEMAYSRIQFAVLTEEQQSMHGRVYKEDMDSIKTVLETTKEMMRGVQVTEGKKSDD